MNKIKEHFKHFTMGFEHMAVALTSILFVSATLSISPNSAFMAVGIATLIFHVFTENKLSSVLGISASYLGGMLIIKEQFGNEAMAFGVLGIGIIYIVLGAILKRYPKLLRKIPNVIFKLSVVYIAMLLIPIGWSMANSDIGYVSLIVILIFYLYPVTKDYALPLSLTALGIGTYVMGLWSDPIAINSVNIITPELNLSAISAISLVSLAVIGEVVGDISATARINNVELGEEVSWSRIFLGMGVANTISSFFGVPTVSYSENNGFLNSIGERDLDPTAQVYTGLIFIFMAFVPFIAQFLSRIPFPVYGALLLFLFITLGYETLKDINYKKDNNMYVATFSLISFGLSYNMTIVSPITIAFVVAVATHLYTKKGGNIEA